MAGSGARVLAVAATGVAAAQYLPSVLTLGTWAPFRSLPIGLCRWRGPDELPLPRTGTGERAFAMPAGQRALGGVALTFDDGPDPASTPAVLDRLDELGLVATFFCLGTRVEANPELVDEIAGRGHQVETHGYRHEHHLARGPRWVARDLRAAREAMEACGMRPTWYRPSYGQITGSTLVAARRQGLRLVLWSAWGREWTTLDPVVVAARVSRRLRGGAIVLLHDSDGDGPARDVAGGPRQLSTRSPPSSSDADCGRSPSTSSPGLVLRTRPAHNRPLIDRSELEGLHLEVLLQAVPAALATDPGLLVAAEGSGRVERAAVHVHLPRPQATSRRAAACSRSPPQTPPARP